MHVEAEYLESIDLKTRNRARSIFQFGRRCICFFGHERIFHTADEIYRKKTQCNGEKTSNVSGEKEKLPRYIKK